MYEFKNVKYKDILDIDNLLIEENRITFVSGPSGSGKSTFLKLLNKMISQDSGNIYYKGKDINSLDSVELKRKVLMLYQSPTIYEGNIRDNLLIGRKFAHQEEINDNKLKEILKKVLLDKNLEDSPANFSGGEKQRLSLARIMVMDFETLILDKPSSALDRKNELEIVGSIVNFVKENNRNLITVSHSNNLLKEFAEDIIHIKNKNAIKEKVNE